MNASKACIMITLFFSMSQGKNHYTVSSINTLRKNLKTHHKIDIKRRWTFQCLADLLTGGYIRRKARYKNDHNGEINQIPSMISFTLSGIAWFVKKGVKGAKEIHKSMVSYLKKGDKRFPSRTDFDEKSFVPADPDERKKIEGLLGIVTKNIT